MYIIKKGLVFRISLISKKAKSPNRKMGIEYQFSEKAIQTANKLMKIRQCKLQQWDTISYPLNWKKIWILIMPSVHYWKESIFILKKKPLENIIATFNKAEDRHSLLPINFNSKYIQKCHTCTQENVYKDVHCNIVHNS